MGLCTGYGDEERGEPDAELVSLLIIRFLKRGQGQC